MGDEAPKIDAKKDGGKEPPPQPPPPPPRDARKPLGVHEKRTARLISELTLRLDDTDEQLAKGSDELKEEELKLMVSRIKQNRDDLSASLEPIASDDPMMMQAFKAVERSKVTLRRLESMDRALVGRTATADSRAGGDKDKIFQQAAEAAPVGYCDGPGHGDGDHCGLKDNERSTYRDKVRDSVLLIATNWTAAINAKHVEELVAKEKTTFEQKLGELLLGLLFQGFGAAAKHAIGSATKKVTKALTKETPDPDLGGYGVTQTQAPDKTTVDLTKGLVEKGAEKGLGALEKSGGHKSAAQLDEESRVTAPADRKGFLEVMKSAPSTWAQSILGNLNQLYDEDLAAIVVSLPKLVPTQGDFEAKIDGLLKRFEEQVLAVNHSQRPISIVGPGGRVRSALVTPDMQMDPNLKGESRNSFVPTGKTKFVRWIDDDMIDMAKEHQREQNQWALPEVRRFDDTELWDADSLSRLASFGAKQPEPDQLVRNRPTT